MTTSKTIIIAGAGELGLRLGRRLAPNYKVVAVRRRSFFIFEKGQTQEHSFSGNWDSLLKNFQPQQLAVAWAPRERSIEAYRELYVGELVKLLNAASQYGKPDLLLVSSSSVWECDDGRRIDDHTAMPLPQSERGQILLEAESLARQYGINQQRQACMLRLSGLYGPQRWPGLRRLRQATPITENPEGWVNLIHIEDASRACELAIEQGRQGCFLVSAQHIKRQELYHFAHLHFGTPAPVWECSQEDLGRRIDSRLFSELCHWKPEYPSVCEWIQGQDLEN